MFEDGNNYLLSFWIKRALVRSETYRVLMPPAFYVSDAPSCVFRAAHLYWVDMAYLLNQVGRLWM